MLHDVWMLDHYARVLAPLRGRTRLLGCVPLDGRLADPRQAAALAGLDAVIVYTDWAAGEVRRALPAGAPPVEVLGHGVDADLFATDPASRRASSSSTPRAPARASAST